MIFGYHDPAHSRRRSVHDLIAFNLTVPAFKGTYAALMPTAVIEGLQLRNDMPCRAPLIVNARGRLYHVWGAESTCFCLHGALQNIPDHVQHF